MSFFQGQGHVYTELFIGVKMNRVHSRVDW